MKPAWDSLAKSFQGSDKVLIADVDCTAGGKSLCDQVGVRGYPTIKHGDPNNLEDYKGGRTYDALKKFAEENLGPTCGPANLDLCDDEKKAEIAKFQAMPAGDLAKSIKEKEDEMAKLESDFKAFVEGLNKQYKEESDKKEKAAEAIKNSGLGLLKAVHKFESSAKTEL